MDESPASVQNGRENQDTKSACNMQALFYCLLRLMRYADVWGVAVQAIVLRNTRLCEMRFIRCVPVKCKTAIIYALFFCALKCVSAIPGSFAARSCEWLRVEAFAAGMPGVVSIQPPTGRLRVAPGLKELEKRMLFPAVLRATACWEICARAGLVPLRPAVFGRQWTKQNKFCIWL